MSPGTDDEASDVSRSPVSSPSTRGAAIAAATSSTSIAWGGGCRSERPSTHQRGEETGAEPDRQADFAAIAVGIFRDDDAGFQHSRAQERVASPPPVVITVATVPVALDRRSTLIGTQARARRGRSGAAAPGGHSSSSCTRCRSVVAIDGVSVLAVVRTDANHRESTPSAPWSSHALFDRPAQQRRCDAGPRRARRRSSRLRLARASRLP